MPLQGLADWEKDMYYPAWRGSGGNTGGISQPGFSMTWPEVPTVTNPTYTPNPAPISGTGPFGLVPGPVGLPDPYANLSAVYPNLAKTNQALSDVVSSKLAGNLSPGTIANIQDIGARFGVGSGMPGSGLAQNRTLRDLGLTSEAVTQQGIQDYASLIPAIKATQTVSPELQTSVAMQNAQTAAAPSPAASASYAQSLYDKYLRNASGPAGGTGAFGGGFMGPNVGGVPFIMSNSSTPSNTSTGGWPWGDKQVPGEGALGVPAQDPIWDMMQQDWNEGTPVQPVGAIANNSFQSPFDAGMFSNASFGNWDYGNMFLDDQWNNLY